MNNLIMLVKYHVTNSTPAFLATSVKKYLYAFALISRCKFPSSSFINFRQYISVWVIANINYLLYGNNF